MAVTEVVEGVEEAAVLVVVAVVEVSNIGYLY